MFWSKFLMYFYILLSARLFSKKFWETFIAATSHLPRVVKSMPKSRCGKMESIAFYTVRSKIEPMLIVSSQFRLLSILHRASFFVKRFSQLNLMEALGGIIVEQFLSLKQLGYSYQQVSEELNVHNRGDRNLLTEKVGEKYFFFKNSGKNLSNCTATFNIITTLNSIEFTGSEFLGISIQNRKNARNGYQIYLKNKDFLPKKVHTSHQNWKEGIKNGCWKWYKKPWWNSKQYCNATNKCAFGKTTSAITNFWRIQIELSTC